eukprot:scaffold17338_cov145-Isochrysis_galbana.AAC.2
MLPAKGIRHACSPQRCRQRRDEVRRVLRPSRHRARVRRQPLALGAHRRRRRAVAAPPLVPTRLVPACPPQPHAFRPEGACGVLYISPWVPRMTSQARWHPARPAAAPGRALAFRARPGRGPCSQNSRARA